MSWEDSGSPEEDKGDQDPPDPTFVRLHNLKLN